MGSSLSFLVETERDLTIDDFLALMKYNIPFLAFSLFSSQHMCLLEEWEPLRNRVLICLWVSVELSVMRAAWPEGARDSGWRGKRSGLCEETHLSIPLRAPWHQGGSKKDVSSDPQTQKRPVHPASDTIAGVWGAMSLWGALFEGRYSTWAKRRTGCTDCAPPWRDDGITPRFSSVGEIQSGLTYRQTLFYCVTPYHTSWRVWFFYKLKVYGIPVLLDAAYHF